MLETKMSGKKVDEKDTFADLFTLEPADFQAVGPKAYKGKVHSALRTLITGKNGAKYRVINAVIGDKGLVSFVADQDEVFIEGEELVLQFTEVVDGRARFNVIGDVPKA